MLNIVTMLLQCWANIVAIFARSILTTFICRHFATLQQHSGHPNNVMWIIPQPCMNILPQLFGLVGNNIYSLNGMHNYSRFWKILLCVNNFVLTLHQCLPACANVGVQCSNLTKLQHWDNVQAMLREILC